MPIQEKERQQGSPEGSCQERMGKRSLRANQTIPSLRHDPRIPPEEPKYVQHEKMFDQHADRQDPCNKSKRPNDPVDAFFLLNQKSHDQKSAQNVPHEAELIDHGGRVEGKKNQKGDHMKKHPEHENLIDGTEPSGKGTRVGEKHGKEDANQGHQDYDTDDMNVESAEVELLPERDQESGPKHGNDRIFLGQQQDQHRRDEHRDQHQGMHHPLCSAAAEF